jgi:predicted transposase YbfD/YdcC
MDYITIEIENNGSRLVNIGELYTILEQVKDNRKEKGKRYSIGILLIVVILAKLCGENTPYGIAEWAKMRGKELQKLFGYHRQVISSNKTLQRLTDTSLEDEDLQATIRHYLHQSYGGQQSVLITIDGKTLRGIIPKGKTRGVHLLAAYLPEEGVVLLQIEVGQKDNEIMVAQTLLRQLDLKGRVVSGDAMFTQHQISVTVLAQGGDYLWFVKDNQSTLHEDVLRFIQEPDHTPGWHIPPLPQAAATETCKQSGRVETRRLTAIPDEHTYLQWPGLNTVFRLERHVFHPQIGDAWSQVVFGITSLSFNPGLAKDLLNWTRQHWGIENKLHYRRDVTLRDDATLMKQTHQAQVVATLNKFVIALSNYLLAFQIWHLPGVSSRLNSMLSFFRTSNYFGICLAEIEVG